MSDKKISQLDPVSNLSGTDMLPIVNAAQTKRTTLNDLKSFMGTTISGTEGYLPVFGLNNELNDSRVSQNGMGELFLNINAADALGGENRIHMGSASLQYYSMGNYGRVEVNNYDWNNNFGWSWNNPDGSYLLSLSDISSSQHIISFCQNGNVGIGTDTNFLPIARVDIRHPIANDISALALHNIGEGVSDYSETKLDYWVSVGNNPDYFVGRMYAKMDGNNVGDGRLTIKMEGVDTATFKNGDSGFGVTSPNARVHIKGSGFGNAPIATTLLVENSAGNSLFQVKDSGFVGIATDTRSVDNERLRVGARARFDGDILLYNALLFDGSGFSCIKPLGGYQLQLVSSGGFSVNNTGTNDIATIPSGLYGNKVELLNGLFLLKTPGITDTRKYLTVDAPLYQGAPNGTPDDSLLSNSMITAYLNEAGNELKFRVKYSNGTLKTATIALT
ncbi:MAG TPA: hypothetical protein VFF27_00540 [Bacteroidia bacterium]|nr:hypothetical protein [Bacteroidia bacterium]